MRIFLPFTTLRNPCSSSSFFTMFLSKKFYEEIALPILSWRPSSLLSWRSPLWSSISIYPSSSSRACWTIFTIREVLFFYSAFDWKKSLSLLHLLLESTSRESQQCTFSMNNIGSRSMHYLPLSLSLSLKCVSLVSADLLKNLWTGAWISINHFNWNKQCLINRIFLSSVEQNDNDENKNTVST